MGNKWLDWYWESDAFKNNEDLFHNKHKRCTCGNHSFNILDKRDKSRELYIRKGEWTDSIIGPSRRFWMTESKMRRLSVMIRYNGKPKPKHKLK
jgi:hypothetical protein